MSEHVTIEHYVNRVMDEITKRDVEQVSERLRALGWEKERTCERITLGLEREREIATVSWICSACGKHMSRDDNYCSNCGARVITKNSETTPKKVVSE